MRNEKALVALIRKLAKVIADEAERNPDFAAELAALLPDKEGGSHKREVKDERANLEIPDVHAKWIALGEEEFRYWARDLNVDLLRAVVKDEDLDPTRKTARWKDSEKLANFLADGIKARKERGSSFLRGEPK
jgi:hypothetical protein